MRLFLAGLLLAGLVGCGGEPAKKEAPKAPPAKEADKAKEAVKEVAK